MPKYFDFASFASRVLQKTLSALPAVLLSDTLASEFETKTSDYILIDSNV